MIQKYLALLACVLCLIGCNSEERRKTEEQARQKFDEALMAGSQGDWDKDYKLLNEIREKDFSLDDPRRSQLSEFRKQAEDEIATTIEIDKIKAQMKEKEWGLSRMRIEMLMSNSRLSNSTRQKLERLQNSMPTRLGDAHYTVGTQSAYTSSGRNPLLETPTTVSSSGVPYRPDVSAQSEKGITDQMIKQGVAPDEARAFIREVFKAEREHQHRVDSAPRLP